MIEFIAVLLLILLGSITINLILYMRLEKKQLWMNQAKAVNKRWIQETCMLPVDNLRLLNGGKDEN